VLLVGLAVTGAVTAFVARTAGERDRVRFDDAVSDTLDAIQERMSTYVDALEAGAGLYVASHEVTRQQFHSFVQRLALSTRYPGNQGIGWSPRIESTDLATFVDKVRSTDWPSFRVWPPATRTVYQPVLFLEPLDRRNRAAIGFDMYSEAKRRAAMDRARDTGEPAATAKLTLEQEIYPDKQPGFVIYAPVYETAGVPPTVAERRAKLNGFVYGPFRVHDLLKGIFGTHAPSQVAFDVYDGDTREPDTLLFGSSRRAHSGEPYLQTERRMRIAGRTWTLHFDTTPHFERGSHRNLPALALLAGVLVSVLLTAVTWFETLARSEAERATQELSRSREALRRANQSKDEFIAMLGHELRNPVGALVNALRLIRLQKLDAQTLDHYLDVAERQVKLQTRLVDDLLDVSRFTTGNIRLQLQPLDMNEVAARVLNDMRARATEASQTLRLQPSSKPVVVEGDPVRLEQVLANLLSNSIKYTPEGGTITVSVEASSNGATLGEAVVRVSDTGMGIAPDKLDQVFDLFAQTDAAKRRAKGGLGIGLTLARRLIELHGGHIVAESQGLERGSEFIIRLPAAHGPALPIERPEVLPPSARAGSREEHGLRVLIIEDNIDALEMLTDLLKLLGHEVSTASDGERGIKLALATLPDVAFVDLGLPVVNGYEVAQRLRADRRGRVVYLVALTGYGQPEDREHALAAGFAEHMVKPLDLGRLKELLARLQAVRRPAQATEIAADAQ
jgi:signal transduction histidine kinase/ActR/RegA family two-component response regulator